MMTAAKREALLAADRDLVASVEALRAELAGDLVVERREAVRARLAELSERYEALEEMPTWPLNRRLRLRFTVANVTLVVPLVAQSLELAT